MTTSVQVAVPKGADYKAEVITKDTSGDPHKFEVAPGDSFTTYVYGTREVTIREVPLTTQENFA